jgi:hypothetical protein
MIKETDASPDLSTKLKACNHEIQNYVIALERENLKLQKQIAKHQAENVTFKNRIKVLEEEQYRPKGVLQIIHGHNEDPANK